MAEYDPEEWGARCGECALRTCREGKPVPFEANPEAWMAFVGPMPGHEEQLQGRPWIGPAGMEATRTLTKLGLMRTAVHWTNVLACRPPAGKLRPILKAIREENKRRKKEKLPALPTPAECCRPRLANELAHYQNIVPMGTIPFQEITGIRKGVMGMRGAMTETHAFGRTAKVLPSLNPAAVLHKPRWRPVFQIDMDRAVRYFRGQVRWQDPVTTYIPSPAQLRAFIESIRPSGFAICDVETDDLEPLTANLRCVQIADVDGTRGVVVPFLSIDGVTRFYTPAQTDEILSILRPFFVDPEIVKVGHNWGYYDRMVLEAQMGVTTRPVLDTLLLHRLTYSELPHSLGFVGSTLTDVVAWKAGKIATNAGSDGDLWLYGIRDVAVNGRILKPLLRGWKESGQPDSLLNLEHDMQDVCVGMHRNGIWIDQGLDDAGTPRPFPVVKDDDGKPVIDKATGKPVLDKLRFGQWHWDRVLRAEAAEFGQKVKRIVGDDDFEPGFEDEDLWDKDGNYDEATAETIASFNPNSTQQLRRVLFDEWKLQPVSFTASGDPSTSDSVLRKLMLDPTIPEHYRVAITLVRQYRKRIKLLGYVKGVRFEPGAKGCHLMPDGVIRANWNATGRGSGDGGATTTGRLTSSPNMQNWSFPLRSMLCARPGNVFVDADFDQVELRLVASLAQCKAYLDILARAEELEPGHPDGDPHRHTMFLLFGASAGTCEGQPVRGDNGVWTKGSGTYKKWRNLAKRFLFAVLYGAEATTMHRVITAAEKADGSLIYDPAVVTVRKIKALRKKFLRGNPEIPAWWDWTVAKYRRDGFLAEPVTGRRRFFADGEKFNELVNFRVQAAAAGMCNLAAIKVHRALPTGFAGPGTGLIGQFHDALAIEVPEKDAPDYARFLSKAMTQTHPALKGVEFTAEAGIGRRLSLV